MADTSLPNLTELNATPANDDELYVVDKSDTTDGASGTNKKITVDNLSNYQDAKTATLTNKTINDSTNEIEADAIHVTVRNESGSPITKGQAVYASGYSVGQDVILVSLADASSASTMPVIGIVQDDIANNATGSVITIGRITAFDTSSFSAGDVLYVSETAGLLTATKPTGGAIVQQVAEVLRSNATTGILNVAISNGSNVSGFGATLADDASASDARTTLGVAIGTDVQGVLAEGAFADGDKTKLDGIEASADVTDATNVTSALASVPVSAHSDVDTDKSKTPADGDVLTFDGTHWNAETPAGGGGGVSYGHEMVISPSYDQTAGAAPNLVTTAGSGGTFAWNGNGDGYRVLAGASPEYSDAYQYWRAHNQQSWWDFNRRVTIDWAVDYSGATGNHEAYIVSGSGDGTGASAGLSGATKYLGIRFDMTSGTQTVYAVSSDGTAEQSTDITAYVDSLTTFNSSNIMTIVHTAGTDDKFYITQGTTTTLRATHSTRVPASTPSSATVCQQFATVGGASSAGVDVAVRLLRTETEMV